MASTSAESPAARTTIAMSTVTIATVVTVGDRRSASAVPRDPKAGGGRPGEPACPSVATT
jgi:hypothetical protein